MQSAGESEAPGRPQGATFSWSAHVEPGICSAMWPSGQGPVKALGRGQKGHHSLSVEGRRRCCRQGPPAACPSRPHCSPKHPTQYTRTCRPPPRRHIVGRITTHPTQKTRGNATTTVGPSNQGTGCTPPGVCPVEAAAPCARQGCEPGRKEAWQAPPPAAQRATPGAAWCRHGTSCHSHAVDPALSGRLGDLEIRPGQVHTHQVAAAASVQRRSNSSNAQR